MLRKQQAVRVAQVMRVCWSLEAALQEEASNHHKLRWSRAMVVSIVEKAGLDPVRYVLRR